MFTTDDLRFVLTLSAALGCGLMAGVFFAFSAFVMQALARLSASEGIAAMQAFNIAAVNSLFLGAFLATSAACTLVVILSLVWWKDQATIYHVAGGVIFLLGSFLVTVVFNVPRNNALALLAPTDPNGAAVWSDYVVHWTAWNHIRGAAALAAAASLIVALR